MANSFKFVGGKLVQRSNEEQARLDHARAPLPEPRVLG